MKYGGDASLDPVSDRPCLAHDRKPIQREPINAFRHPFGPMENREVNAHNADEEMDGRFECHFWRENGFRFHREMPPVSLNTR